MDIGRAAQYWTSDPDWIKKLLIGGLVSLLPFLGGLIVSGYYIRAIRLIQSGNDNRLPEWNEWGEDLVRGLKLFVAFFLWLVPLFVAVCLVIFIALGSETAGSVAALLFFCLAFTYFVALMIVIPIIVARFVETESISEGLNIGRIFSDGQKVTSHLFIFLVVALALQFIGGILSALTVGIAAPFVSFIIAVVLVHLIAQISMMLGYGRANQPQTPPPPPPPSW